MVSDRKGAPPRRSGPAPSSPVAGPSGLPNLNLTSDEGEFLGEEEPELSGFDSNSYDPDDQGRPIPSDECLGVSSLAYRGLWTVDRLTGRRFLPIFLVSGYRVDYFPDDRTVRVAWHRYDVDRHLPLSRSRVVQEVMRDFVSEFTVQGDTQFAEYIRGGEFVRMDELLRTFQEMTSGKASKTPRQPTDARALSSVSSTFSQSDTAETSALA